MKAKNKNPKPSPTIIMDGTASLFGCDEIGQRDRWYEKLHILSAGIITMTPIFVGVGVVKYFLAERESIETLSLYSGVLSLIFLLLCLSTFDRRLERPISTYVKICALVWTAIFILSFCTCFLT